MGITANASEPGQIFFIFYLREEEYQGVVTIHLLGAIQENTSEPLIPKVCQIMKMYNSLYYLNTFLELLIFSYDLFDNI